VNLALSLARCGAVALFVVVVPAQTPDWITSVDALVAERLARPDAVGFSVGVAQGGQVLLAKGYGRAEAEFSVPATPQTKFRIGSITKQFTAALVMRLVERHQVALDDGLEQYVPQFPLQGRRVTVQMLLDHSSGIPSYTDLGEAWQQVWPQELSHDQLLALVRDKPFDFEPGTDWHYNNTGYYLLGMLLEKVHGAPFADIVQRELAGPLGLANTRYDSNRDLIPGRAQGYTLHDGVLANDDHLGMSQPGGAGGLLSTGEDLVRWSMLLASGKVVSPASYARMTKTLVLAGGRDTRYGFGLMRGEVCERPAVFHGGGIHGFNSMLLHIPDADLHVAVISNSERASSDELSRAIVREVLRVPAFAAKNLPQPAELRARLVGDYEMEQLGVTFAVTEQGDRLRGQAKAPGQGAFDLLWQGGLEFRASFDHAVKIVFSDDGKAMTLHQGGGVFTGERQ
jgi:D-alanyl-D-alanine carboxypeptidase